MQDNAEDIDLEYLSEDFPKLLNSMKGATDRIKGISTSLRTFSRADTDKGVGKGTGLGLAIGLLGETLVSGGENGTVKLWQLRI